MSVTISGSGQIVKQVVVATYSTATATSSTTLVTTGFSGTITPLSASSKILVMITSTFQTASANTSAGFGTGLYRGATQVWVEPNNYDGLYFTMGSGGNFRGKHIINYLDSPATTSATTYTLYFDTTSGTTTFCTENTPATMILMEISQS